MTEKPPSLVDDDHRLRFACACASGVPTKSDPWVAIVNQRKLNDGTKELILNAIYRRPRTITQLAELLGISPPAVHRHVADLLASELIREVDAAAPEPVLDELAAALATAFRARQGLLAEAFARTTLPGRGEPFEALLHYLYA